MNEETRIENLKHIMLVKMLCKAPKQGLSKQSGEDSLKKLVAHRQDAKALLEAAWERLLAEKLVESAGKKGFAVTNEGQTAAETWLGAPVAGLKKMEWKKVKAGYLCAKALGVLGEKGAAEFVGKAEGLRAEILRQAHRLDLPALSPLPKVKEELFWKYFHLPLPETLVAKARKVASTKSAALLVETVLLGILKGGGIAPEKNKEKAVALLSATAVGANSDAANALFEAVQQALVEGQNPIRAVSSKQETSLPPAPVDLETFARQAITAATRSPSGWLGDQLVFVSHAWRQYQRAFDHTQSLPDFKARLLEAQVAGLLAMTCADLAPMFDQTDVTESEVRYRNSTFHFLRVPGRA